MARMHKSSVKLVVVDRDGTLNEFQEGYIQQPSQWRAIPGALEAVALLNGAGWHVVVATNQPGLGRGVIDMDTLNAIHQVMHQQLAALGARVDAVFFCPHLDEDGCDCRKPLPGLIDDIALRYGIDVADIHCVGDALRDVQASVAAGAISHLVCTGESAHLQGQPLPDDFPATTHVHASLMDFARAVIASEQTAAA